MNMRKFTLILLLSFVLVLMAACGDDSNNTDASSTDNTAETDSSAADSDEVIHLRAATGLSAQHGWWQGFALPLFERVEELTDGKVQIDAFGGGELVEIPQEPEALQNGTVDIAIIVPFYAENTFPASSVTFLPVDHTDAHISANALRSLMESDEQFSDGRSYYESHYEDNGLFSLAINGGGVYTLSTADHEIQTLEDLEDISVRTPNLLFEMMAENMEVNSVSMTIIEAFDALSRGAFEGIYHTVADWAGAGFQDLLKYTIEDLNLGASNGVLAMTNETWESFPEDVQDAFMQAYDELYEDGINFWADSAAESKEYNLENGGQFVSVADLDPELQEHFNESKVQTWYSYIDYLEDNGYPGKDLAIHWRDILLEEGAEVPEEIMNLEDY